MKSISRVKTEGEFIYVGDSVQIDPMLLRDVKGLCGVNPWEELIGIVNRELEKYDESELSIIEMKIILGYIQEQKLW